MPELMQCIRCGFLENGYVKGRPCPGYPKHDLKPLSRETIAQALGSTGGRPPKYKTPEERAAAKKQQQADYKERQRAKSA